MQSPAHLHTSSWNWVSCSGAGLGCQILCVHAAARGEAASLARSSAAGLAAKLSCPLFKQSPTAATWRPSRYLCVGHGARGAAGRQQEDCGGLSGEERAGGRLGFLLLSWGNDCGTPEETQTFLAHTQFSLGLNEQSL